MLENEPVDQGRYGDIWKGVSHDQVVCVKILRPYQRMPTQPLFKVIALLSTCEVLAQVLGSESLAGSATMGTIIASKYPPVLWDPHQ